MEKQSSTSTSGWEYYGDRTYSSIGPIQAIQLLGRLVDILVYMGIEVSVETLSSYLSSILGISIEMANSIVVAYYADKGLPKQKQYTPSFKPIGWVYEKESKNDKSILDEINCNEFEEFVIVDNEVSSDSEEELPLNILRELGKWNEINGIDDDGFVFIQKSKPFHLYIESDDKFQNKLCTNIES